MQNLESDIASFLKAKLEHCTTSGDSAQQMAELRRFLELERNMRRPVEEEQAVQQLHQMQKVQPKIRHLSPANRPHLRAVT